MNQRIFAKLQHARGEKRPGIRPQTANVRDGRPEAAALTGEGAPEGCSNQDGVAKEDRASQDGAQQDRAKTGPKTKAGRAAVRMSAYKHGLAGQSLVVPRHEVAAYREFCQGFVLRYKPADLVERQALQKVVDANWKCHVATALEYNLLNTGTAQSAAGQSGDEELNVIFGKVDTWVNNSEEFERFSRYASRWNRESDRLLAQFRALQAERRAMEQEALVASSQLEGRAMAAGAASSRPGFIAESVREAPVESSQTIEDATTSSPGELFGKKHGAEYAAADVAAHASVDAAPVCAVKPATADQEQSVIDLNSIDLNSIDLNSIALTQSPEQPGLAAALAINDRNGIDSETPVPHPNY